MSRWTSGPRDIQHLAAMAKKTLDCIGQVGKVTLRSGRVVNGQIFPKSSHFDPKRIRYAGSLVVRSQTGDHEYDYLDVVDVICSAQPGSAQSEPDGRQP